MKVHFTMKEVAFRNQTCLDCKDHITLWANGVSCYCLKYKTDSIVFLADKCEKLEEIK